MTAPPTGPRTWLPSALTALVSVVLVSAILEIGLRVTGSATDADAPTAGDGEALAQSAREEVQNVERPSLRGMATPSLDPDVVYELKPNHDWTYLHVPVHTNSLGFRGPEWATRKDEGTLRIVGIGDSIMWGWGVPIESTYLSDLERRLRSRGLPIQCLNLAVPGYNTEQEVAQFRRQGLALSPDLVIVGYALNDTEGPIFGRSPPWYDGFRLFRLVRTRLEQLGALHDLQGFERVRSALASLAALTGRRRIAVVVIVYPQELRAFPPEPVANAARAFGFAYVDLFAGFRQYYAAHGLRGLEAFYVAPNDAHPDPAGHALIADLVEPELTALLEERIERRKSKPEPK